MMFEQSIILVFIIVATATTIFQYSLKAKKAIEYKNDERWMTIQNKANNIANFSNSILIVIIAVGQVVSVFSDTQITFTLNRVLVFGLLYIGLRNLIELLALLHFDKQL